MSEARAESLRRVVEEETRELGNRVEITEREAELPFAGVTFHLVPSAEGAAELWLDVDETLVSVTAGHGSTEILLQHDEDWLESTRQVIRCVRDGHYWEEVKHGWVFLKVAMHFEGMDWAPRYRRQIEDPYGPEVPAPGEHRYEPW